MTELLVDEKFSDKKDVLYACQAKDEHLIKFLLVNGRLQYAPLLWLMSRMQGLESCIRASNA